MARKSHYFIYFECKDNIFCLKYEISQKKVVLLHRKFEKFYKFMKKLSLITVMLAVLTIVCFTSVGCTDKKPAPAVDSTAADTAVADTQAMDSTEKLIEETPMPKAADELFDDFCSILQPVANFRWNASISLWQYIVMIN